jgi:hypothetical protein
MLYPTKRFQSLLGLAIAVASLLGILSLVPSSASAASTPSQSITISPTSIDESVQPGSTKTGSFQVINSGDTNFTFNVYATPYRVNGEDYNPDFTALPGRPNIVNWVHFSNGGTGLAAHQTITIDYSINVPAGAPAGGYYAVAFAQTKSKPSATTGVVITDRVGEIFYLRVAGNVKQAGKLLSWQSGFLQTPPLTGVLRVEDNGGYNFPTTVHAKVKNIFGHTVYSFTTTKQILPQTIRRIKVPWQSAPPIGIFKISGTASFLGQTHQLPTKYVLVMSQPIQIILLILVVGLIAWVIYRWRNGRRDTKQVYRRG